MPAENTDVAEIAESKAENEKPRPPARVPGIEENERHPLTEKLRAARGKKWGRLIKRLYYAIGPDLAEDGRALRASEKFTAFDLGDLATKYKLPLKTTCEYLQELPRDPDAPLSAVERNRTGIHSKPILPPGTYTDLKERGLKASDVMDTSCW